MRRAPPVLWPAVKKLGVYVATILVAGAVLAVAVIVAVPAVGKVATAGEAEGPPIDLSRFADYAVRSQVYAADGSQIATLHGEENREPVTLDQIPATVKDSILAVEDAEFYQHRGINLRALTRAMVENVQAGGVEQGGSTITQQLVKNALLNDERVLNRKVKEAALAIRLENQMTKDEILEAYLNTVYFGSGAYGVQAAAETYWGKNVGELNWAEGAMLAAVISNPIAYDPTLHPDVAKQRRDIAVDRIVAYGSLTREQGTFTKLFPLPSGRCTGVSGPRPADCGEVAQPPPDSYFVDEVKNELLDLSNHQYDASLGTTYDERYNAVFGGGLRISTTQDPVAQAAAQDAHDNTFDAATARQAADKGITTAMVSLDSSTGAVRALVGGPGFEQFQYDIATHEPGRQTGSTFKTFVLLTALEQGIQPDDYVAGGGSWVNKGGTPDPYVVTGTSGSLTSVVAASSNGAFVRLGQTVGLDHVVDMAERLGVRSQFDPKAKSMPLGVFDVTPLEMASAYSAIPNGGIRQPQYFVDKIADRNGNVLYTHAVDPTRGFSQQTACLATQILENNVQAGTGKNAQLGAQPAAGKTGTTESNSNTWFVGFTPYLTTAVWMGIPESNNAAMGNLAGREQFGGLWPATIFANYNKAYLANEQKPVVAFPTCAPLTRPSRPAAGAGDPYGTLNGGSPPGTVTRPSGGGDGTATTVPGTDTTVATTDTTAPAATTPTTAAKPDKPKG
jgi:penicillin-binding protein 1A